MNVGDSAASSESEVEERQEPRRSKGKERARSPTVSGSDDEPLRPRAKKAQQKAVKMMLAHETAKHSKHGDRLEHLEQVRHRFREVFDIDEDVDLIHYEFAPVEDVEAFLNYGGNGPSLDSLQWAADAPAKNAWNAFVAASLAKELMGKQLRERWSFLDKKKRWRVVNTASHAYWTAAVLEKFVRMRRSLTKAAARAVPDPMQKGNYRMETEDEVFGRMGQDTMAAMEMRRSHERRGQVSKMDRKAGELLTLQAAFQET